MIFTPVLIEFPSFAEEFTNLLTYLRLALINHRHSTQYTEQPIKTRMYKIKQNTGIEKENKTSKNKWNKQTNKNLIFVIKRNDTNSSNQDKHNCPD